MLLTDKGSDPEMLTLFHPCQLEERFGGTAKTPTNFWPPYVGKEFVPENISQNYPVVMGDEEYRTVLRDNPEILCHPEYLTSP